MSDQDKTVFHRPQKASPGAPKPADRSIGQPDTVTRSAPPNPMTSGTPPAAHAGERAGTHVRKNDHFSALPGNSARRFDHTLLDQIRGLNPIVGAAQRVFTLYGSTRQSPSHRDIKGLNGQMKREIQAFEQKLQAAQYPQEIILSARYVACSLLDEAVLNTPWGTESPWAQFTLLSAFHKETSGGEKFFQLLDRMRQQPAQNTDILEFMYVCLSLGFEGRFRFVSGGREQLEHLRVDLFQLLKRLRPDYERDLSPHWRGFGDSQARLKVKLPLWVIAAFAALLGLILYSVIRYWLYEVSDPVVGELEQIEQQIRDSAPASSSNRARQ